MGLLTSSRISGLYVSELRCEMMPRGPPNPCNLTLNETGCKFKDYRACSSRKFCSNPSRKVRRPERVQPKDLARSTLTGRQPSGHIDRYVLVTNGIRATSPEHLNKSLSFKGLNLMLGLLFFKFPMNLTVLLSLGHLTYCPADLIFLI